MRGQLGKNMGLVQPEGGKQHTIRLAWGLAWAGVRGLTRWRAAEPWSRLTACADAAQPSRAETPGKVTWPAAPGGAASPLGEPLKWDPQLLGAQTPGADRSLR